MEFFDLEYSLAVFDPESNFVSNCFSTVYQQMKLRLILVTQYVSNVFNTQGDRYQGRESLAEELNVNSAVSTTKPIISTLLENHSQVGMPKLDLGSIGEVPIN